MEQVQIPHLYRTRDLMRQLSAHGYRNVMPVVCYCIQRNAKLLNAGIIVYGKLNYVRLGGCNLCHYGNPTRINNLLRSESLEGKRLRKTEVLMRSRYYCAAFPSEVYTSCLSDRRSYESWCGDQSDSCTQIKASFAFHGMICWSYARLWSVEDFAITSGFLLMKLAIERFQSRRLIQYICFYTWRKRLEIVLMGYLFFRWA